MARARFLPAIILFLPLGLAAQSSEQALAVAIDSAVTRIADGPSLWPGYQPGRIPLAIYTGERTWLFRHPSPPAGFTGEGPIHSMLGRHPVVTSNSSADLGGVATATLLADGARAKQGPRVLAAVALHEAFHVYQRAKHPTWSGNEGELFTYPFERADQLRLRRVEADRLRRALAASSGVHASCHARAAMEARAARFALLTPGQVTYERKSELNEGLATWVQLRALGQSTVVIPAAEYAATQLRDRFYTIGPAIAFLLDRVRPGWVNELEQADTLSLDGMLTEALGRMSARVDCAVPEADARAMAAAAERDAAAVVAARTADRAAFDTLPGWKLVISVAPASPLWPQGFDPLNVTTVAGGVRHDRMLKLGNDSISVAMIDEAGADLTALTEGAGAHPLFNGVKRVVVAGLGKPAVTNDGGATKVSAPGLAATIRGATVTVLDDAKEVRVGVP
jgi:hypothetical protein